MQSDHRDQSFIHTAGGQSILLLVALIVVVVIASFTVW
jgi:hypothetical protein